jgi:hypothetical protein
MSSGSVRLHPVYVIPQHEAPPDESGRTAIPDGCCEEARAAGGAGAGRLWREGGRVMYQGAEGSDPEAVRVVWARPLSGRGGAVSIMQAGKKKELAYFPSLEALAGESHRIALEELAGSLVLPRITAIVEVKARLGNYYWDVETDMGRRRFLLSAPENNTMRPMPDAVVLKDVSGNCYEINPVSGLDKNSLRELDRVL